MCGACGTGLATAPWEVQAHGGTLRDLRRRAAEAQDLCGRACTVTPNPPAGYLVRTPTGAVTVCPDLDALVRRIAPIVRKREDVTATRNEDDVDAATRPVAWALARHRGEADRP